MERRYAKSHEWVTVEGDTATVGISEHAVEQLGDVVYIELPPIGKELDRGDVIGDIESVKAVSQVYAPVAGTVSAVNGALESRPELINESPLGDGWIVRIECTSVDDSELLSAEQYEHVVAAEG